MLKSSTLAITPDIEKEGEKEKRMDWEKKRKKKAERNCKRVFKIRSDYDCSLLLVLRHRVQTCYMLFIEEMGITM